MKKFIELISKMQLPRFYEDDILIWLDVDDLRELYELVGHGYFCEGSCETTLMGEYLVINNGIDIIEYMGIDINDLEVEK